MRTVTMEIFGIRELSAEARRKALDDFLYRRSTVLFDQEEEINTVTSIAQKMDWEYDYNSYDGEQYSVSYRVYGDERAELSGARAMAYIQNNYINAAEQPKEYWLGHVWHCDGRKNWTRKSRINFTIDNCPFTGFYMDYCFSKAWEEWKQNFRNHSTVQDFANMVADHLAKEWTEENEYRFSDEGLMEFIDCNDYEFLEDGTLYRD